MAHLTAVEVSAAGPRFLTQRRRSVIDSVERFGLDYVIPSRIPSTGPGEEEWELKLRFLPAGEAKTQDGVKPLPVGLTTSHLRITLGEIQDPGVRIQSVAEVDDETLSARVLRDPPTAEAEASKSPPIYSLDLVDLPQVDRFFRSARFVFQEGGGSPEQSTARPSLVSPREIPEIDYLAKDYESFRRLLLEQLRAFVPSWHETHAADLGITLVELLAYAADYLSYYQDAAATEAYIATARRRISVRRHARLVDYRLHEGCNARCWVQFKIDRARTEDGVSDRSQGDEEWLSLPAGIEVLTYSGRLPSILKAGSLEHTNAMLRKPLVFRTLEPCRLHPNDNSIPIYTWGTEDFVLPAGTTSAALCGHFDWPAGQVLIFERRWDPGAGSAEEVDPRERQVVRLRQPARPTTDPAVTQDSKPMQITEIEWFAEDALKVDFPVSICLSDSTEGVLSLVRGNLVLVDHGGSHYEVLEPVPAEGRFNPSLQRRGLTHRVQHDPAKSRLEPATGALLQDPRRALPELALYALEPEEVEAYGASGMPLDALRRTHRHGWLPRQDLLASHRFARDFVAEMDNDSVAYLRFGDDRNGLQPVPGTVFQAVYRVGLGPRGNVGAYALRHAVIPQEILKVADRKNLRLVEVKNHLAGGGGQSPEPLDKARLFAPAALRSRLSRQSCVIEADYVEIAERHPEVRRAAAKSRWNGSRNRVELYVQRPLGRRVDAAFRRRLQTFMEPHLIVGSQLEISAPRYIPLDIRLTVWAPPTVRREVLAQQLQDRIDAGEVGLLQVDYFTFGKSVYKSEVIAEAMALPQVDHVDLEVFQRWGRASRRELDSGEIEIQPLEIAQLENDPAAPHRGTLQITFGEHP